MHKKIYGSYMKKNSNNYTKVFLCDILLKKEGGIVMNDFAKQYGRNSIIFSILLIVLSLFLIFSPTASLNAIMVVSGIALLIIGFLRAFAYFSGPKELKVFNFELTEGVLFIIVGLIFLFNPTIVTSILSIIIGAWIILKSVTSIQLAVSLKSTTNKWAVTLIFSILTLIAGIIMIFNPFATSEALIMICGIMLLSFEIINIVEVASMMHYIK